MGDFHFLRPEWFLALIPTIFILVMLWRNQSGASAWHSVFDEKLLSQLWLEPPGKVSRKPLLLIGLGWVLAILALAGPTWERQSEQVWRSPLSTQFQGALSRTQHSLQESCTAMCRSSGAETKRCQQSKGCDFSLGLSVDYELAKQQ